MKLHFRLSVILLCVIGISVCIQSCGPSDRMVWSAQDLPVVCIARDEDPLLLWAADELADDFARLTGSRPVVVHRMPQDDQLAIIIGRSGHSFLQSCNVPGSGTSDQWEHYQILPDGAHLVISGSDVRGTVYGIFELSERMGVSPWHWWADVPPTKRKKIRLEIPEEGISASPSVQYRGIFLNDEDWGLQPWAAKNFEKEVGDIGPKTYEKIFQLLLRLKANTIWPAMHPSTQPFFTIPGNKEMAQRYQIVIGTSHAEPMLRNNVREWDREVRGPFNYFTNSEAIIEYWEERIRGVQDSSFRFIVTMGLRGEHDSRMQGGENDQERMEILEKVIDRQRQLLENTLHREPSQIPQAFIPYKEVLYLYDRGLEVPVDITIVWTDDNYGYIRRLSSEEEQKRAGGSGIYYHLSYWGRPHDYLWLSTTQPGLIWYEMTRAWENGARKMWIANVGDIKPAEYPMEFFLDLAWDINSVDESTIHDHLEAWAAREFGEKHSEEIADMMNTYYRLACLRKPEYMGWSRTEPTTQTGPSAFSMIANGNELNRRIANYQALVEKCSRVKEEIPTEKLDAFFQLVEYPIRGAANMNYKFLYYQRAVQGKGKDQAELDNDLQLAQKAYEEIQELTTIYNEEIAGGKWNHIMHAAPRGLPAYMMPEYTAESIESGDGDTAWTGSIEPVFIRAVDFTASRGTEEFEWRKVEGLGYSKASVTLLPAINRVFGEDLPYLEYTIDFVQAGVYEIEVRVLPTHSNHFDHEIIMQLDGTDPEQFAINTRGRSEAWKVNVLRNHVSVRYKVNIDTPGKHTLRIAVNQTGIVIDQVAVHPENYPAYYEIP